MGNADSLAAIKTLPGGISSRSHAPSGNVSRLLAAARSNEHQVPCRFRWSPGLSGERPGRPVRTDDVGRRPIHGRVYSVLGRMTGYVGVTNALGPMHGERFTGAPDLLTRC